MKLLALLVTVFVSTCSAQLAPADLTIATLRPPIPDPCQHHILDINVEAFTAQLERGDVLTDEEDVEVAAAASSAADKLSIAVPVFRCEDGPRKILHTVPGEFHWPPIRRGSCDNLYCKNPPCIARKSEKVTKCVHVFKIINGRWVYQGRQARTYWNHLACSCKSCNDIRNRLVCTKTKPCPNSHTPNSFCYWRPFPIFTIKPPTIGPPTILPPPLPLAEAAAAAAPEPIDDLVSPIIFPIFGRCRCCSLVCKLPKVVTSRCTCECPTIKCPKGQTLNTATCECECPKGSIKDAQGNCVGRCEDVNVNQCEFVSCRDNPHFQCKSDGYRCSCPTCDSAGSDSDVCGRTRCLDQPLKPRCKMDAYSRTCRCPRCDDQMDRAWCDMTHCGPDKCRWDTTSRSGSCSCPRCEDQKDKLWCDMTHCGPNGHLECRWDAYSHKCSCPH